MKLGLPHLGVRMPEKAVRISGPRLGAIGRPKGIRTDSHILKPHLPRLSPKPRQY